MNERRISFNISEETYDKLKRFIPYGQQRYVFRFLAEGLAKELEETDRADFFIAMYTRRLRVFKLLEEEDDLRNG
ncbi:hypothetical protein HN911_13330 [Candidatus Bathyarchaeota archaeon]|nr:hypothetical protein [Candidatus Bathyarchaeota archaeon]